MKIPTTKEIMEKDEPIDEESVDRILREAE